MRPLLYGAPELKIIQSNLILMEVWKVKTSQKVERTTLVQPRKELASSKALIGVNIFSLLLNNKKLSPT